MGIPKDSLDFPGGSLVKNLPDNVGDAADSELILRSGRSPGEGNGNPLQYPCLRDSMNRGAWWAIVRGVTGELNITEWLNNNSLVLLALWTFGRGNLLVLTLGLNPKIDAQICCVLAGFNFHVI